MIGWFAKGNQNLKISLLQIESVVILNENKKLLPCTQIIDTLTNFLVICQIKFRVLFTLRHFPNLIISCIRYIGYKNKTMYRFHLNFQRNTTKFHSHKLTGKLLAFFPNRDVRQDSKINRPP